MQNISVFLLFRYSPLNAMYVLVWEKFIFEECLVLRPNALYWSCTLFVIMVRRTASVATWRSGTFLTFTTTNDSCNIWNIHTIINIVNDKCWSHSLYLQLFFWKYVIWISTLFSSVSRKSWFLIYFTFQRQNIYFFKFCKIPFNRFLLN